MHQKWDTEVKKDWKTANEGDWVYTDDGRIVQLLKVSSNIKHHNDRKNYKYADGWVRTIVGTFIITPLIFLGISLLFDQGIIGIVFASIISATILLCLIKGIRN